MNGSEPLSSSGVTPPHSPITSVRQLAGILIAIFKSRAELATLELQDEQERLISLVIYLGIAAFSLLFTAILGTFFIVVLFWDTPYRLVVLGGMVAIFAVTGVVSLLLTRLWFATHPPLFGATLAELKKDSVALKQELS